MATQLAILDGGVGPKPRIKFVAITPSKASIWLKSNTSNRHPRESHVARLARDMEAGRWDLNGECIKFSPTMKLLDGQHRLFAIVRSGVTITIAVAYDVQESAIKNIDIGIKRMFADRIKLEDVSKNHSLVASLTSMYHLYLTNATGPRTATHGELSELLEKHAIALCHAADFSASCRVGPAGVNMTAAALAYMFTTATSPRVAADYTAACIAGEALTRQHPAWTVRAKVQRLKEAGTPLRREDHFALIVRGWNALREGRPFSKAYTRGHRGPNNTALTWREIKIKK